MDDLIVDQAEVQEPINLYKNHSSDLDLNEIDLRTNTYLALWIQDQLAQIDAELMRVSSEESNIQR